MVVRSRRGGADIHPVRQWHAPHPSIKPFADTRHVNQKSQTITSLPSSSPSFSITIPTHALDYFGWVEDEVNKVLK